MPLHERIALVLGWTASVAPSFSLAALRDLVRPLDGQLAAEIDAAIRSGPPPRVAPQKSRSTAKLDALMHARHVAGEKVARLECGDERP